MENNSPMKWIMDLNQKLNAVSCRVIGRPTPLEEGFQAFEQCLSKIKKAGASVWWIGNGGSSAICSHLSQDLLNKLGLRSMVLTDAALLTCMANDYGYTNVYHRPLEILTKPGDLLIAISSSGKSENILSCARLALERKMSLVTLSGFYPDNPLWQMPASVAFHLPSDLYGLVEIGHEVILHAAIETIWLKTKSVFSDRHGRLTVSS